MTPTTPDADDLPPDVSLLRRSVDYDAETGIFVWKAPTPGTRAIVGERADRMRSNGYRRVVIQRREFLAHRAAWMCFYGVNPPDIVDHINGVCDDNRIANLRQADLSENNWNRQNKHAIYGAAQHHRSRRFTALIRHRGQRFYLGSFGTKEEARAAYQQAATQLRGEFHE